MRDFVQKTVHGAFLRQRETWFEGWNGRNYVIWPVDAGTTPSIADGQARLALLARLGPTESAYDFAFKQAAGYRDAMTLTEFAKLYNATC